MLRLHKYLAHCGIASRRKAEVMISEGRVEVNGRIIIELGVKVDPARDRIRVDGKPVQAENKVYYLLNKPRGYVVTAADEYGRRIVLDLLDGIHERVYPVGRLDRDSEGLLVLTNDGDLAYYLTHPSCEVRKTYHVTVKGKVSREPLDRLMQHGIQLGRVRIKPLACKLLKQGGNETEIEIVVGEGINREVRRIFAALGHEVKRLVRTNIGPLTLKGIPRGKYRALRRKELERLQKRTARALSESGAGTHADQVPTAARAHKKKERARNRSRYYGKPGERLGKPDPALAKGAKSRRIKPRKKPARKKPAKPVKAGNHPLD